MGDKHKNQTLFPNGSSSPVFAALRLKSVFWVVLTQNSEPGSDAASAGEAPAAHGFSNGKKARRHENQPQPPQIIAGDDDARNEAQRAHDAARHAPVAVKVRLEETAHGINLTQLQTKANRLVAGKQGHNLTPPPFFSLSSPKGGEGRGEEADYLSSNPLAPTLSPLGRGEGVGHYQVARRVS